jgi:hypothetical protein
MAAVADGIRLEGFLTVLRGDLLPTEYAEMSFADLLESFQHNSSPVLFRLQAELACIGRIAEQKLVLITPQTSRMADETVQHWDSRRETWRNRIAEACQTVITPQSSLFVARKAAHIETANPIPYWHTQLT